MLLVDDEIGVETGAEATKVLRLKCWEWCCVVLTAAEQLAKPVGLLEHMQAAAKPCSQDPCSVRAQTTPLWVEPPPAMPPTFMPVVASCCGELSHLLAPSAAATFIIQGVFTKQGISIVAPYMTVAVLHYCLAAWCRGKGRCSLINLFAEVRQGLACTMQAFGMQASGLVCIIRPSRREGFHQVKAAVPVLLTAKHQAHTPQIITHTHSHHHHHALHPDMRSMLPPCCLPLQHTA